MAAKVSILREDLSNWL